VLGSDLPIMAFSLSITCTRARAVTAAAGGLHGIPLASLDRLQPAILAA
jgi:hypothetical protein